MVCPKFSPSRLYGASGGGRGGAGGGWGTLHFQIETFILGSSQNFLLIGWCDGPIKMAHC